LRPLTHEWSDPVTTAEVVKLYGAAWSVYVRIARLALEEKQIKYSLVEVDVFAETGVPQEHFRRHPFGRIPAFEHGDFRLYETGAIVRYIDEAFPGCKLQPTDLKARAKMNQILGILDAYAYRTLVWDIYVERVVSTREGRLANEQKIAAALPRAAVCLSELTRLSDNWGFLIGHGVTLADLYAAPIFACFMQAPECVPLMEGCEKLISWWQRFAIRDSMSRTQP
jgi:glutathione S-transferase